jgi:hypothetical protein
MNTLFLIFILDLIKSEICPLFGCHTLPSGVCTNKTSNDSALPQVFDLQTCPQHDQQCPFYNLYVNNTLTCETVGPYLIKQYPSAQCNSDDDCIFKNCTNNACIGVANGETCKQHRECNFGYACMLNTSDVNATVKQCLPQKKEKDSCTEDFDCVNTHGCYNQTCTKYFSLADGSPVEFSPARYLSFCQSGFEYGGACVRLSLPSKDTECNDDLLTCNYTNYNNASLVLPQNCLCGYNPSGKKYCKMGNGHQEYVKYVTSVNKIIQDYSKCNTEERGLCNYNRRYPSKVFTDLNQKLYNAKVESEMHHQLIGADKCVIDVAFPQYTPDKPNPPDPTPNTTVTTCAKYNCVSKADKCVHSHFETLQINGTDTYKISVNLSDICKSSEYCYIGGSPNSVFYNGSDIYGACKNYTKPSGALRYPGEACSSDIDCWRPATGNDTLLGTCQSGKCGGYKLGENCTETAECLKGNYCSDKGQCATQKREKENCTKTTECKNNLLCYQGKCQSVWYSLNVGTNVTGQGDYPANYYCKFGIAKDGVCESYNTTDTVDSKSGLVICSLDRKCNYTTFTSGAFSLDCECGYNSDGNSYCPKGHSQGILFLII